MSFGALAEFDGALTQEFDAARRAEIQEAFAVTRETANQTSIFFANRAAEEALLKKRAEADVRTDAQGNAVLDAAGQPIPLTRAERDALTAQAASINSNFGSGSPLKLVTTAFNAAASGGNAAGGLGSLVQGAAVGVIQSLAANQIKHLADSLMTKTPVYDKDGNITGYTSTANAQSELARALMQGINGCAFGAVGGGNCGGGALGGAGAAVLGSILNHAVGAGSTLFIKRADGTYTADPRSLEEQQAVTQLVGTLMGVVATVTGVDAPSAVAAAIIEAENNTESTMKKCEVGGKCIDAGLDYAPPGQGIPWESWVNTEAGKLFLSTFPGTPEEKLQRARAFDRATDDDKAFFGGEDGLRQFINTSGTDLAVFRDDPLLKAQYANALATSQSARIASAVIGGTLMLNELKSSNPVEYKAYIDQFDGNEKTAAIAFGLIQSYGSNRLSLNQDIQNTTSGIPGFSALWAGTKGLGIGFKNGVVTLYDSATNPSQTLSNMKGSIVRFGNDPGGTTGSAIKAMVKAEYEYNIAMTAAVLAGDDKTRLKLINESYQFVGETATVARITDSAAKGGGALIKVTATTLSDSFKALSVARAANTAVSDIIAASARSPSPLQGATIVRKQPAGRSIPNGGDWTSPYMPGSTVTTFTTTQTATLVRVSTGNNRGSWYVEASAIAGKTPDEIRQFLALPETPTHIQTVTIPKGTTLKEGMIGPQPRFTTNPVPTTNGGIQFQMPDGTRLLGNAFGKITPLVPNKPVPKPRK